NNPKAIKSLYRRVNADGSTVAAMDVLASGIGEIIGGSQREERLDVLDQCMTERGIDKDEYAWYRDLRRCGTVPHAGFGLGFERTLVYVTGLADVRGAIPSPRTPGSAVGAVMDALRLGSSIEAVADGSKKVVLVGRLAQVAQYTIPERALPHAVVRISCNQNGRYGLSQSHQMAVQF